MHATPILDLARSVALAVLFRALPFLAYLFASRRSDVSGKLSAGLLYVGASTFVLGGGEPATSHLGDVASSYLGWMIVFVVVYALSRRLPADTSLRLSLAVIGAFAFVAVPLRFSHTGLSTALVLVAIDGALSIASLVVGDRLSWSEAAIFVFVDPSLCVRTRARRVSGFRVDGANLLRAARGALALMLGALCLDRSDLVELVAPGGDGTTSVIVRFVATTTILCLSIYATHVGLADVQISGMRMSGFELPERYVAPLSAVGPRDFWCRWNTYMNAWLRDHVYVSFVRRTSSVLGRTRANDAAILATFVVSGGLHTASARALRGTFDPALFWFFAAQGLAMVLWSGMDRAAGDRTPTSSALRAHLAVSRLAFLGLQSIGVGWVFGIGSGG